MDLCERDQEELVRGREGRNLKNGNKGMEGGKEAVCEDLFISSFGTSSWLPLIVTVFFVIFSIVLPYYFLTFRLFAFSHFCLFNFSTFQLFLLLDLSSFHYFIFSTFRLFDFSTF